MAGKRRKTCGNKWIDKQTLQEVRDQGEAYWGPLIQAKTRAGTVNKAFAQEMRCHGVKMDVRRMSGYAPELHLVPIKGQTIKYPF